MSASTEKKNRIAQREAGTDRKTIQAQEEAKKKAIVNRRWIWTMIGIVILIAFVAIMNSPALFTKTTAMTIGDKAFTPTEVNYNYANSYLRFANNYGQYASLFGLDTSSGIGGLKGQACSMTGEENYTWKDYFLDEAIEGMQQNTALLKYADENGIELTEDELTTLEANYEGLDDNAKSYGYKDADGFIGAQYGTGANLELAKRLDRESSLAAKAYNTKSDEVNGTITDDEVGEKYPTVAVRHILIKAEADENGEYTDEALAKAETRAGNILRLWQNGKATEESFAEMAEKYSEDDGSNTNGGLYNSVMEGQMVAEFNDFCFDEARQPGDTCIVHGESGSYNGYHVMYFVGEGDPADNETGRSYILNEKMGEWLDELVETMPVVKKFFFRLAGKV